MLRFRVPLACGLVPRGIRLGSAGLLDVCEVFGEEVDPPSREDDMRLPVSLRLKHGKDARICSATCVGLCFRCLSC